MREQPESGTSARSENGDGFTQVSWVTEMHVDGFRFDLAPTLAREKREYSINAGFFRAIAGDPVSSRVKLIAEPWDLGPEGYQLGGFPFGMV